jgi:hypothetical protein
MEEGGGLQVRRTRQPWLPERSDKRPTAVVAMLWWWEEEGSRRLFLKFMLLPIGGVMWKGR